MNIIVGEAKHPDDNQAVRDLLDIAMTRNERKRLNSPINSKNT